MTRRDLLRDISDHAVSELEYVIHSESSRNRSVPQVTAQQALKDRRFFELSSSRDVTRVLFISRDTELLNPTQQSLDGYIDVRNLFDEVHILILREGIPPKHPVLRVAPNVWLYTAAAKSWWQTPAAGMRMLREQLEFAAGFRPDLIVARDPFESAWLAIKVGKRYNRPTQLHVTEDYSNKDFVEEDRRNFWRRFLLPFTIPRFVSIRTATSATLTLIQKKYAIPDIAVLPRYQDYEALITKKTDLDLKQKYKPFIFFLLYIGQLDHESTLYRAIDAARFVLRNPRVGMLVLGDGKSREEFQKRTKILGIEKQVVFETKVTDVVPYLKAANILIVTDTDAASEEVVLKGAAAGIPMVLSQTDKRKDVFTDGESAFLCEPNDTQAFTNRINDLLNNIDLRHYFSTRGQEIIRQQFHSDPREYQAAYRSSIEQALFVETEQSDTTAHDAAKK